MSGCLCPHGLEHTKLPCPSLSPVSCSDSCSLNWWCYLIMLSSATPSHFAFSLSRHQDLSTESTFHIKWPEYWSFSFSISPSNEYLESFSFRIDLFDFLAVQRNLRSLIQHHNSKASILWSLAFFMVQLSLQYMTTGKTIALTIWTSLL